MDYIILNSGPILLAGFAGSALLAAFWRERLRTSLLIAASVATLWLAAILAGALILAPVEAGRWTIALGSAFIIWVGFVLPSVAVTLMSRRVAWQGIMADAGAWLAAMLIQATLMQLIGLVKP